MGAEFAGKTVLVTGGGSGIGREIALEFGRVGARVAVCDIAVGPAESVAEEIAEAGSEAKAYAVDVVDFAAVQDLCGRIAGELEGAMVLVNNAGITRDKLMLRMSEDDFDKVIAVNLKGAFNFTKGCARAMMKARWGRIINISSVVGQMGNAGQANYAASKAGLIGLTKSSARELASRSITVNAVSPGFIETPMTEALDEAMRTAYFESIPLARAGTPADVAGACLFLASESAAYITGQVLRVDGGMLM